MSYIFVLMYGIVFGGLSPLTAAIRGNYFGRKASATIMSISQFPMSIAMLFAPLFAGYMLDTSGTYLVPFTTFAATISSEVDWQFQNHLSSLRAAQERPLHRQQLSR